MTDLNLDAIAARAEAHPDALWIPAEPMDGGPYHDDTNGSYVKAWVRNSPVGSGFLISVSLSQSVDVPALLARCRDLEARWDEFVAEGHIEGDDGNCLCGAEWICPEWTANLSRAWQIESLEAENERLRTDLSGALRGLDAYVGANGASVIERDDARAAIDRVRRLPIRNYFTEDGIYRGACVDRDDLLRALDGDATDPQTQEGP